MGVITSPSTARAMSSTTAKKRKRDSLKPWYESVKKRRAAAGTTTLLSVASASTTANHRVRDEPTIGSVKPASFTGLPGELRNRIYDFALLGYGRDTIRITSGMDLMGRNLGLGLFGSCKTIRREALSYFLKCNSFRIDVIKLSQNTRKEGPFDYFTDCYDSRAKAYEAPIRKFIDCTKYTTRLNKIYGLKTMTSLDFAYFHVRPATTASGSSGGHSLLPDTADLLVALTLKPDFPYYSLTVDGSRTTETNQNSIDEVLSRMASVIGNMVELRSVRKLAADDMVEMTNRYYYSCMNLKIGE